MPPRGRKRKSEQSVASEAEHAPSTMAVSTPKRTWTTIATKLDSAEESSPRKRQRTGVTLAQKQALIDNLQLEVTERARKLRAQYHLQAQGLRTRIEIRVNRIPRALRKTTMGELLQKHSNDHPKPAAALKKTAYSSGVAALAPPVPEKDYFHGSSLLNRGASPARATVSRAPMYMSDKFSSGDKENQGAHLENPKMRPRANYAGATAAAGTGQVLSPASSNARVNPGDRERTAAAVASPTKSLIARPMSPTKQQAQAATNLLSAMVEKARSTRTGTTRKPTTSSTATSATSRAQASRAPSRAAGGRAPSRMAKRISGTSESSETSTSTVVRKVGRPPGRAGAATRTTASAARKAVGAAATSATAAPASKKTTVMSSIKKGVTGAAAKRAAANATTKAAAAPAAPAAPATTRSGRVLRKRD